MTTSDCIALVSAVATASGVFVSIFALWKQMHKLSNQLIIQQFSDYTKRYQDIILHFPEDINEQTFVLSGHSDYKQTMRYMRAYFDLCFEEWYLYQRCLIDKEIWSVWKGGMQTALSKAAFKQGWELIKKDTKFGEAFERYIASIME